MNKFSIVLPVYNVEKYIKKCLDSIVSQTYTNFEVIIIDDCTPDNAGNIVKSYCERYDFLFYYKNKSNLGLSATRNRGLEYVSGDYVLFLDSDDYFDKELLKSINESLLHNPADVVVYGLIEEYLDYEDNVKYKISHCLDNKYYNDLSFRESVILLEKETLYGYAWNKAYNVEILRKYNIKFKTIKHIEDILFNIDFFDRITTLNIINNILYHYVQHQSSRLTNMYMSNYLDLQKIRIQSIKNQLLKWDLYTPESVTILANIYHKSLLSAVQREIGAKNDCSLFLNKEFSDPFFKEYRWKCKTSDIKLTFLYVTLDFKNKLFIILISKFISFIKINFHIIFNKLKNMS